jgi:hypothetical protein
MINSIGRQQNLSLGERFALTRIAFSKILNLVMFKN